MKRIFNAFPFFWALKLSFIILIRRFLKIPVHYMFSQSGEYMVLRILLGSSKDIFYVDVGCNDPIRYSSTLNFYIEGGHGICIDANSQLTDAFKRVRFKDIVVNEAISNVEEEVTFYISSENAVSTADEETYKKWSKKWKFTSEKIMTTKTLDQILEINLPENQQIDILSIDVEGYDFKALQSMNLNKYRPRVILVEIHHLNIDTPEYLENEVIKHLDQYNFKLKYYSSSNAYFVDNS